MVRVRGLDGKEISIDCEESTTGRQAKAVIEELLAVPAREQVLLADRMEVKDSTPLRDGLRSGEALTLVRRKRLWDAEIDDGETPEQILEYSTFGEKGIVRFEEKFELTSRRLTAIDSGVFESVASIQLFKNDFRDDDAFDTLCEIIASSLCADNLQSFSMGECGILVDDAVLLVDVLANNCPSLDTLELVVGGENRAELLRPLEALVASSTQLWQLRVDTDDHKDLAESLSKEAVQALKRRKWRVPHYSDEAVEPSPDLGASSY